MLFIFACLVLCWPSGKLPFDCQKLPMSIFLKKKDNFWQFFFAKNDKFLVICWHSNGNFPEGQHTTSNINVLKKQKVRNLNNKWTHLCRDKLFLKLICKQLSNLDHDATTPGHTTFDLLNKCEKNLIRITYKPESYLPKENKIATYDKNQTRYNCEK